MKKISLYFLFLLLEACSLPLLGQEWMSLEKCKSLALQRNKQLQIESIKQNKAIAKRDEVRVNFYPQVSFNAAYMHIDKPFKLIDWDYLLGRWSPLVPDVVTNLTSYQVENQLLAGIVAVQPLFMGGKIFHGYRMADAAVRLSGMQYELKKTEVEEEIEDIYWKTVSLSSKEKLLEKLLNLLDEATHNVDLAVKEGIATKADALAIRVKRSEAELNLLRVRNGVHLSSRLLAQTCGLPPTIEVMPEDILLPDSSLVQISKRTFTSPLSPNIEYIERRPEIRALNIADTIFSHKMQMAAGEFLPKVFFIAGYATTNPNPFSAPRKRFDGSWNIGIGITMPITGIAKGIQQRKQAASERREKQLERQEATEKIRLQMEQALLNRDECLESIETSRRALQHAEENLRYASLGYKEGVIPLINLTEAQTAWAKAHDSFIDSFVELKKNESKLEHIFPK